MIDNQFKSCPPWRRACRFVHPHECARNLGDMFTNLPSFPLLSSMIQAHFRGACVRRAVVQEVRDAFCEIVAEVEGVPEGGHSSDLELPWWPVETRLCRPSFQMCVRVTLVFMERVRDCLVSRPSSFVSLAPHSPQHVALACSLRYSQLGQRHSR